VMQGQHQNVLAIIRHPSFARAAKSVRQTPLDRCLVCGLRWRDDFQKTDRADLAIFCSNLIEAGANPNAVIDGYTAIKAATDSLNPDDAKKNTQIAKVIDLLRLAGAQIDVPSAVLLGDEALVAELLRKSPESAHALNPERVPALHLAVKMNAPKIAAQLLKAGCDVNIRNQAEYTGTQQGTALHEAAFWGRSEIARQLIAAGANVNARGSNGDTPLHEAVRCAKIEVARVLLEHGAQVDAKDDEGKTPLQTAEGKREVRDLFEEFRGRSKK
jgi:ankyrin repeat protein